MNDKTAIAIDRELCKHTQRYLGEKNEDPKW